MRIRVASGPRDLVRFPEEDMALGHSLNTLLLDRIRGGAIPRPAALALGRERVWQYDLVPILKARGDLHRFLAAVSGQDGIVCVALLGVFGARQRRRDRPMPAALTFIEWPDCRWWLGQRYLNERRQIREDWPPMFRCAEEGAPRPGGLGGWWSRGRREGLKLRATNRANEQPGAGLVH